MNPDPQNPSDFRERQQDKIVGVLLGTLIGGALISFLHFGDVVAKVSAPIESCINPFERSP